MFMVEMGKGVQKRKTQARGKGDYMGRKEVERHTPSGSTQSVCFFLCSRKKRGQLSNKDMAQIGPKRIR